LRVTSDAETVDSGRTAVETTQHRCIFAAQAELLAAQVPHQLINQGSLPEGYVTFAANDPNNGCVLPNGNYRVWLQLA
jgi:hypothetical protein